MIKCQICNQEYSAINKRHLAKHNISKEEYITRFPDAPLQSDESSARRKQATAERNAAFTKEEKLEIYQRIVATKKSRGVSSWNKGKAGYTLEWSEEAKKRAKERDPWNKGLKASEETCRKISESRKESFASGDIIHWNTGKTTSDETKQKISAGCIGNGLTPEQKKRHQEAIDRITSNPNYKPGMEGKNQSAETRQKISDGVLLNYDSTRKTMEDRGFWVPLSEVPEFTIYKRKVWRFTNQVLHLIPGYDESKRGLNSLTEDNFQVDHNFSIYDGFKNDIDPEIVGHLENLSFVHWQENNRKWHISSISLEDLLEKISTEGTIPA